MSDITRKEHITRLKAMLNCIKHDTDPNYQCDDCDNCEINYMQGKLGEIKETLAYAISSLETDEAYQLEYEQPEFCGDCISREATKEAIRKRFPGLHDRCEVNIVINSMPCVLPKADVPDNNVREIRDCISRKDTIEYLKQVTVTDGITFETGFKQILLDIENMPSVLPKVEWIPVTERLPEEHICNDGWREPSDYVLVFTKCGCMHVTRWWSRFDERWVDLKYPTTDEVIAWMPLPEPYKRGDADV